MDSRGTVALFEETARKHPDAKLDLLVMSPSGPERSVMPHVFSNTRRLQEGDVFIHSRRREIFVRLTIDWSDRSC